MSERVLHAVTSLERGGIEIWLLDLLRRVPRDRYRMDFLVVGNGEGVLAPEVRALGGRVFVCPEHRNPWRFARCFGAVLRDHGPYDIVHTHVHHFGGVIARLAARRGVPKRIVHSHNDTRAIEAGASPHRRLYLRTMEAWIRRYATWRIGVSGEAAADLFGPGWTSDPRAKVVHCGLDLARFAVGEDRATVRRALGLPPDGLVLGHVGRFYPRKNHHFLLEVVAEVLAREPRAALLSLGDGPLMAEIAVRARELGIAERIVFAGTRADVPTLLTSAMDVFVLPSHHEGLSIALLEAQAAGLPCVISDALTGESDVVRPLIQRLPLAAPAARWAEVILDAARHAVVTHEEAQATMRQSDFAIATSVDRVLATYAAGDARGR